MELTAFGERTDINQGSQVIQCKITAMLTIMRERLKCMT